jgi:hypothetical protein
MPNRDFTITFHSDTTQALAGMKQLEMEFKTLEAYINNSVKSVGAAGNGVNQMTQNLQNAIPAIDGYSHASSTSTASMIAMGVAIGGTMMAIQAGISVFMELGEMANKARDKVRDLAIETMDLRDKMRELANLKGAAGPDNIIAGETVQMALKAGMMPEEMVKYLEQFEGSAPAGRQKGHIDEKTEKELMVEGAKFGIKNNIKSHTSGDLAGVISQYTDLTKDKDGKAIPQNQRAEKAMAQMGRIVYGLNEGRGNVEPLVRGLLNTAGSVVGTGAVEDLGEYGALYGVSSTHANPKEAGTRVRQAIRGLRDTEGSAGNFLKLNAKIKDSDTHVQRLEKIKPLIDAAKASGLSADTYLNRMGFKDQDEIRAIIEETEDLDIIKQRIAKGKTISGKDVMNADDKFMTSTRTGIRRNQKSQEAARDFLRGEQAEQLEMAKKNAEMQLHDEGNIDHPNNFKWELLNDLGGLRPSLGWQDNRSYKIQKRAEDNLLREAQRKGISTDKALTLLGKEHMGPDETWRRMVSEPERAKALEINKMVGGTEGSEGIINKKMEENAQARDWRTDKQKLEGFNALAKEVERAGGNVYSQAPSQEAKTDKLIAEAKETNRLLAKMAAENRAAMNGPAGPAIPPMRAAAAPKRP